MSTVHVIPVDDLIDHDTSGEPCVCIPDTEHVPSDTGGGWLIITPTPGRLTPFHRNPRLPGPTVKTQRFPQDAHTSLPNPPVS